MTAEQLDNLTRQYLAATFDEIEARLALPWDRPGLDAHGFNLNDEAHRLGGLLAHASPDEFLPQARKLAPDADDATQRKLARRLIEAKLEAITAELRALNGEPLTRPADLTTPAVPRADRKASPKVSEIVNLYAEERMARGDWTRKTETQSRSIFAVIVNLLGDPQVGAVTKDDIRKLGLDIVQLPSNMTKKFPRLSAREVLKRIERDKSVPRLAPRSINKYQQLTRTLFKWAAEHDYIVASPATVLKEVKEGRARDDRKPFTDDDLRAYFAKLDEHPERPELYWLPRILAYSGMRLGEAAQLTKKDFRLEGEVLVWDVNAEGEGKKLKTDASERLVPVHPRLVELGVREWIEGLPGPHLFGRKWRTPLGIRGPVDQLSKLLNRKLRESGITDKRKTGAHSFRHTVSTRLKDEGVPEYQIADILGHELDSMTVGRYGDKTNAAKLAEALKLLQLPI